MTEGKNKFDEDAAPDLVTIKDENDTGERGFSRLAKPFRRDKPAINGNYSRSRGRRRRLSPHQSW